MFSTFTKALLLVSCLFVGETYCQKYEAESGILTPDPSSTPSPAVVADCDSCSGGAVVNTRETGFEISLNVAKEAKYNVYIKVSSPNGQKTNTIKIDDLSTSITTDSNHAYIRLKAMSNVKLSAGVHTFTFSKSWGWVYVDYVEVEEAQVVISSKLEAEDGELSPATSDGASIVNCASCSGGKAVSTKESGFSVNAVITKEANYNIYLMVASPNGTKTNTLIINPGTVNALSVDFTTTLPGYTKIKVVANQKLSVGTYLLEIRKSWGWIDVDFLELEEVMGSRFNLTADLVTPNPSPEASCLYNVLLQNYGKKIISGVMTLNSFDESDSLKAHTGKEPALIGLDFMHNNRGYTWYDERQNLKDAKAWTAKHGVVTLMWHWRDPLRQTEGFYVPDGKKPANEVTTFDISKVNNPSSPEYIAMLRDIDSISVRLREFQDNNIPVLWRPLHEAAGGWFWWGAKSGADLQTLWRLMYDRMVTTHGLKNLIWVWTNNGNDEQWYPGDAYVDIVGVDIYNVNGDHGSQVLRFNALNDRYEGKKILALTEVEATPDVDNLVKDEAAWSWFMPWYGDYAHGNKPQFTDWALWNKMFASDYVLTLDEMPVVDATCTVVSGVADDTHETSVEVYPTLVDEQLMVKAKDEMKTISVYDGMGILINKYDIQNKEAVLPFGTYKLGLYMVTVDHSKTFKVFKR